jgi:hypothetical protein
MCDPKNRVKEFFKSHEKNGEKRSKISRFGLLNCVRNLCEESPNFTHVSYRQTLFIFTLFKLKFKK